MMKRILILLFFPVALLAQQLAPELSLSANGETSLSLYPGWPLIINMTIMNSVRLSPSANATTLVVAPQGMNWTDAIQLNAVSSSGQAYHWPLKLVGVPSDPALTLHRSSYVRVKWQMAASDVSALPPDTYQLTASLQVNNSSGWNGMMLSTPLPIVLGPEPTLAADQQSEKALLIAEYDTNAGDLNGALTNVEQLLQAQPNNPFALSAAANLLELQGYPTLALFQANDALTAYYQANPALYDPPSNLLSMSQRLFIRMATPGSFASPTNTLASGGNVSFSPTSQTVTLTAMVSSSGGSVEGGTVNFKVSGVGNPVTSGPVTQGNASVLFSVPAGTKAGSYSIQAAYNGTTTFSASIDSAHTLTIAKATPTITWNTPASVPAGTTLGPSQLNATVSVPGTLVYNPPAGTVMPGGSQTLNLTFTPTDSTDYNSTTASVSLSVLAGVYSGSVSPTSATIKVGRSQNFAITINSSNFQGAVSFGCAHPPIGISCSFSPSQTNLTANGRSTTILTVTVNAKPTSSTGLPSLGLPTGQPSSPRIIPLQFAMTLLVLAALLAAISVPCPASFGTPAPKLSLAPFLLLAVSLTSCTSASLSGESASSGGNGSPATVSLVIQGTSGSTIIPLGTISITVP